MASIKLAFAAKATITFTSLNSLANGSGAQSAVVDNSSNDYIDANVRVQLTGTTSCTLLVDFYVYSALGDTTYTDGASGSDASFTAANRRNARYLGSVQMTTSGVLQGDFRIAAAFDGIMPSKWGLIAINNCGAALPASTHTVEYEGISASVT